MKTIFSNNGLFKKIKIIAFPTLRIYTPTHSESWYPKSQFFDGKLYKQDYRTVFVVDWIKEKIYHEVRIFVKIV